MNSSSTRPVVSEFIAPAGALFEGIQIMSVSENVIAELCAIDLRWGDLVEVKGEVFLVIGVERNEVDGWGTPEMRIQLMSDSDHGNEVEILNVLVSEVFSVIKLFPRH